MAALPHGEQVPLDGVKAYSTVDGSSLTAFDFTGNDPSTPQWSIPADGLVYIVGGHLVMIDGNQVRVSH